MNRLHSTVSQFSDDEEVEKFPEDHFGSDDDDLYDSEFGSAIHDFVCSVEINDKDMMPLESRHNLTTITEESANQVVNDFSNISFKPANDFLKVFEEDQRRVEWENLLHPELITDEMYKKKYDWEPSILTTTPPLIVEESHQSVTGQRPELIAIDEKKSTESVVSQFPDPARKSTVVSEAAKELQVPTRPTKIPIRRPSSMLKSSTSNAGSISTIAVSQIEPQTVSAKVAVNRSQDVCNQESILKAISSNENEIESALMTLEPPEEVANKENMWPTHTPKKSPNFNETIISAAGHAISTPKDTRENTRKELSLMCHSISTIGADSPKVRPKLPEKRRTSLRRLENLNLPAPMKVLQPITDSLSTTAIDRALDDFECHSLLTDATEVQQRLLQKVLSQGSIEKQTQVTLDPRVSGLMQETNRLERQMESSLSKRRLHNHGSSQNRSKFASSGGHRKSFKTVMPTIPESLSSTAIDKALNEPMMHTFVSDATEVQNKFVYRILNGGSLGRRVPHKDMRLFGLTKETKRLEEQVNKLGPRKRLQARVNKY